MKEGDVVLIGGEYAHIYRYEPIVGCKAKISYFIGREPYIACVQVLEGVHHGSYCCIHTHDLIPLATKRREEDIIGKEIRIGGKHADRLRYHHFVGHRARIVNLTDDNVLVCLLEAHDPKLEPYIGDLFVVHQEDLIFSMEDAIELADRKCLKAGDMIRIGNCFAKQMGYEDSINQEAFVAYRETSYAQVVVATGPTVGQLRDIHIEDCHVIHHEEAERKRWCVLIDHDQQIIFYAETGDILARIERMFPRHHTVAGTTWNLSSLVDKHGYRLISAHESELAELTTLKKETNAAKKKEALE